MTSRVRLVGRWCAAALLALAVSGCSAQLGDRESPPGAEPDRIGDVDYVEVFRNADDFPNVARICVEGLAFASTSSGGPSLVRMDEWDAFCRSVGSTDEAAPPAAPETTAPR